MDFPRLTLSMMIVVGLSLTAWAGDTFVEKDGVVSIEAEHYTERSGPWYVVKGRNTALNGSPLSPASPGQNAVMIKGGSYTDHLRYAIHFNHAGTYRLWLLGSAGPRVDEVRLLFRAEAVPSPHTVTFSVTLPDTMGWSRHTHWVTVRQPGWYRLLLVRGKTPSRGRAVGPGWKVDKILLIRGGQGLPSGDGPPETINDGQQPVPQPVKGIERPLTDEVWELRDGYLVIEAEPLRRDCWGVSDQPTGFTGAGYLVWYGFEDPGRETSPDIDETGTDQGPPDSWLVIRLNARYAGRYRVDLRNFHSEKELNTDCWVGKLGPNGMPEPPVRRSGDSLKDGPGFSWLDWGVQAFDLKAGENTLYIAGRSRGFGLDRIAIYREGDEEARTKALDPATKDNLPAE